MGLPDDSDGKEFAYSAGDLGLIPGLGRSPGGGHGNPVQCSCLENPHGQRSLTGYRPGGHKKLDTTDQLSTQHWEIGIISTYLFDALSKSHYGRKGQGEAPGTFLHYQDLTTSNIVFLGELQKLVMPSKI